MSAKNFFRKLFSPVFWGNVLAIIVTGFILFFLTWKGIDLYTHHGESVEIPDVTGKMKSDAIYILDKEDLDGIIADSVYIKSKEPGLVISQKPLPGARVKPGRNILLTINSKNAPGVAIPDIAGNSSLREARSRLVQIGFKVDSIVEKVDGEKDWVYSIKRVKETAQAKGKKDSVQYENVYKGDKVPRGTVLRLVVGRGAMNDQHQFDGIYDYQ